MAAAEDPIRLSVVLAATHDSDVLHEAAARHRSALERIGGELLIADGSDEGLPPELGAVLHIPGADVFTLRAAALQIAGGELIATTEDHTLPEPDWHSAIVRAHRERPDALAIGGAVTNGSRASMTDRANFLMTFGMFLPPLPERHPDRVCPPVNVSFKRAAFDGREFLPGAVELEIAPEIYRDGSMLLDDRIVLAHVQPVSIARAHATHFHNGRSTAGLPRRTRSRRHELNKAARTLFLPFRLISAVVRSSWHKPGYRRDLVGSAPMIVSLAFAHAAGEIAGTLAGPGGSPKNLD